MANFESLTTVLGVVTLMLVNIKTASQLGIVTLVITSILAMIGHALKAIELWLKHRESNRKKEKEKITETSGTDIHINGDQNAFVDGNIIGNVMTGSHNRIVTSRNKKEEIIE